MSSKYLSAGVAGDGNSKIVEFLYKKNFCMFHNMKVIKGQSKRICTQKHKSVLTL